MDSSIAIENVSTAVDAITVTSAAASSGLTASVQGIKNLEKNGAAAVVLKSIFEEEIISETQVELKKAEEDSMIYTDLSETLDYIDLHIKEDRLNDYLKLIRDAKKEVLIPVIASINCVSTEDWIHFTSKIELETILWLAVGGRYNVPA